MTFNKGTGAIGRLSFSILLKCLKIRQTYVFPDDSLDTVVLSCACSRSSKVTNEGWLTKYVLLPK